METICERDRDIPKFTLGLGAVVIVPLEFCLATRDQEKKNHTDRTQTDATNVTAR